MNERSQRGPVVGSGRANRQTIFLNCLLLMSFPTFAKAEYAWTIDPNVTVGFSMFASYTSVGLDIDDQPIVGLYNLSPGNGALNGDYGQFTVNKRNYVTNIMPAGYRFEQSFVEAYNTVANGAWPSLVTESNGNVHVAYNSSLQVRYASRISGAWSARPVTAPSTTGFGGTFASLAVGADHYPRVAYFVIANLTLHLATWNGTSWDDEILPGIGGPPRLILDNAGSPCLAYIEWGTALLKYAQKVGGSWTLTSLPFTIGNGGAPSLKLDASQQPAIAFRHNFAVGGTEYDEVILARRSGVTWSYAQVSAASIHGGVNPVLEFDAQGSPVVVYGALFSSAASSSVWSLRCAVANSGGTWPTFEIERFQVPRHADYDWTPLPSMVRSPITQNLHVCYSPDLWPVPYDFFLQSNKVHYALGVPTTPPPGGGGGGAGCPYCLPEAKAGSDGVEGFGPKVLAAFASGPASITVRLATPQEEEIRCVIFDLAGRMVASTPNTRLPKSDNLELHLEASTLGRGIYFVRAQSASGRTSIAKVLLNRN